VVFPAVGSYEKTRRCFGIQFICSLEALVGVLFAGFCGAILYGKVSRVQSIARVLFSDPIVIRYGDGVEADLDPDQSFNAECDDEESPVHDKNRIPCPVLEFRIINLQNSVSGGEIIDASLNCVASIEDKRASLAIRESINPHSPHRRRNVSGSLPGVSQSTVNNNIAVSAASDAQVIAQAGLNQAIDEGSCHLVPRRIFSKIELDPDQMPFFKRVWIARHVMDENSPLLTHKARHLIKKNRGYWPQKLNNHAAVRKSLRFQQIIVNLSGTSNITATDVYSQKIYDFVDINIGYKFAKVLFRGDDGSLNVDSEVLNDILEQDNGGAEPFLQRACIGDCGRESLVSSIRVEETKKWGGGGRTKEIGGLDELS